MNTHTEQYRRMNRQANASQNFATKWSQHGETQRARLEANGVTLTSVMERQ